MVTEGLPRSYLFQQCRNELNKVCHIDCLPGSQPGAKVHSIKDVIGNMWKSICKSFQHQKNPDKIHGDGARMTRNSTFALLSFSILQTGEQVVNRS